MLRELLVEGLGVIERAELALEDGSTALTGETGAGKTLLVAALSLLLGGRADRQMVRADSGEARIEGRFEVPAGHPAAVLLADNGLIEPADGPVEIVVFRTIGMGGGGRIRVNGRMATAGLVAELGELLVEIAGQHEHQRLGSPAHQRMLLDRFCGDGAPELAAEVAEAYRESVAASRALDELTAGRAEREREADLLRHEVAEIEGAQPQPGEWEALTEQIARLERAETLTGSTTGAAEALRGDGGALDALRRAADDLARAAGSEPELAALAQRLESAALEVADISEDLARRSIEADPAALEAARERLDVLARLRRRFGEDESAVLAHLEEARARLETIARADEEIEASRRQAHEARARALEAATRLSAMRGKAARELSEQATELLGRLAMGGSSLEVALTERDLYEGGLEDVELRLAAAGQQPRPVAKIASGGELSRIALALHLLTKGERSEVTMVFDEVDAGVGGEAARAVASAIADLAKVPGNQVLVVTHLPQVAAFAQAQFRVGKEEVGGRVRAVVRKVDGDDRVEEVSRMLAGLPESERAREHAQELLDLAAR